MTPCSTLTGWQRSGSVHGAPTAQRKVRVAVGAGAVRGEDLAAEVVEAHPPAVDLDRVRVVFVDVGHVADPDPLWVHGVSRIVVLPHPLPYACDVITSM